MSDDLVHVHIRLSPDAARAWTDAANRSGSTITGLAEAIGRRRIRAISLEPATGEAARQVDAERKRRPGTRAKRTTT